ncbi:MAG: LPS-assembly protein LptD [Opitutaceae bacterium]|nr:LPS-assembly protein LptD [Cytophagales bacterium]
MLCVSTPVWSRILPKANFLIVPPTKKSSAQKDSTKAYLTDTTKIKRDTIVLKKTKEDGIQTSVKYSSADSMVFDAGTQTMKLFGNSKIDYGDMGLTAEQIDINWQTNNVDAHGVADSNGVLKGMPMFKDKQDQYQTKRMIYNFKTKKGIISEVITKQGDGYIHGEKVKKNAANELFVTHSKYTTCNLAHPHYHISSTKIKMIPEKKVISGPFNLVINDVPTPLGFIFGFFPIPKHRASGFIVPTYGESQAQGFYLQSGGFYWAANDYIGARFLADVYSLGGAGAQQITEYRNRYHYEGTFNFKYNWVKIDRPVGSGSGLTGTNDIGRKIDQHTFWVQWRHSTLSKKLGRLTADVNTGTTNYNQLNTRITSATTVLNPTFQSSIQYTQNIRNSPFSYGLSLRQNQSVNGIKNFTLPDFNLAMNRVMPFQNVSGGKKTEIIRKFNLAYNFNLQNLITNDSSIVGSKSLGKDSIQLADKKWQKRGYYNFSDDFNYLTSPGKLNNGIRHSIPISTSVKVLKYFSLNPNMTYEEFWYNRSINHKVGISNNGPTIIKKDTVQGFSRASQYSMGTGLTTRVYGTFFIRKGRLEALRHTLIPNLSYTYRPDFAEPSYGYYDKLRVNNQDVYRSKFEGFVMGGPGIGKTSAIGLSLNNNFELKVKEKSDSVSAKRKYKKISLLDNLGLSSAYNLAADSFNLSNIAFTARTKLFSMFDIAYSGSIDPYDRENVLIDSLNGITISKRKNQFQWNNNKGIGNLVTSNLAFSFNLNSEKLKRKKKPEADERASGIQAMSPTDEVLRDIKNNPNNYLDFTIPWSIYIAYNLNYNQYFKPGTARDGYNHSITYNGDLSLSEKWKIQFSSGFNLTQKLITYTRFGITRDLHCWVMSLNWIPPIPGTINSGSYNFQLNVKSSVLQDLKLTKNRFWTDQ